MIPRKHWILQFDKGAVIFSSVKKDFWLILCKYSKPELSPSFFPIFHFFQRVVPTFTKSHANEQDTSPCILEIISQVTVFYCVLVWKCAKKWTTKRNRVHLRIYTVVLAENHFLNGSIYILNESVTLFGNTTVTRHSKINAWNELSVVYEALPAATCAESPR